MKIVVINGSGTGTSGATGQTLVLTHTTIKDTDQEAEIFNATKRMVRKIPMKSGRCLLQVW